MKNDNIVVRIFMLPQQFPCGPQSSCCGPIGQTEQEIQTLKTIIEKELHSKVEVLNAMNGQEMKNHLEVVRFIHAFGAMALPIITLNEEVVSIGKPNPEEAVMVLKQKMEEIKEE